MTKEVGCEYFLQAIGCDPVLLRQDAPTSRKHADDAAAIKTTQTFEERVKKNRILKKKKKHQTYLEKRPLKKAFTSKCGFGIMPAFR